MAKTATSPQQLLRYYGSKYRLAPFIISWFPPPTDYDCYVEPYCGGANVWQRKKPSYFEVLNDIDGEVVNFFEVLRSDTNKLVEAIELTPFSRAEYRRGYEPCDDPLEAARRFYIRSWQSRGGAISGWRFQKSYHAKHNVRDWNKVDHLWAIVGRLKQVQLECDDALKVITRYDTPRTLFYVDPPYLPITRSSKNGYRYEMSVEDHQELAGILCKVQGKVAISHYDTPLYDELYVDWYQRRKQTTTNNTTTVQADYRRTECLWFNY